MRGYRHMGLLLLAGLAAACQKETVAPVGTTYATEAILFTSPYTVSRSPEMRYGSFNVGDQVGVLGYCGGEYTASGGATVQVHTEPWTSKRIFCAPEVFYNQELTYAGNGTWNYTWNGTGAVGGLHPWLDDREDYLYTFFAYYPHSDALPQRMGTITLSGSGVKGTPTITYTMPYNSSRSSSTTSLDLDVVPDFMIADSVVDHQKEDGAVSLNFHHMFCALEFEISNYNDENVEIDLLRLSGSDFFRQLSVTGSKQTVSGNYSGRFNMVTNTNPISCPAQSKMRLVIDERGNVGVKPVDEVTSEAVNLFFIPNGEGKITESGKCTVEVTSTEGSQSLQDAGANMVFRAGTRYIFSINIVGNDFILEIRSEDNWYDGGDSDIRFD